MPFEACQDAIATQNRVAVCLRLFCRHPFFNQNKANVLATLEEYIRNLSRFRELLKTDQYEASY